MLPFSSILPPMLFRLCLFIDYFATFIYHYFFYRFSFISPLIFAAADFLLPLIFSPLLLFADARC